MTAFVWDLDGTLIDSYPAIMRALEATYQHYDWEFDDEAIYAYVMAYSVSQLLQELAQQKGLPYEALKTFYSEDLKQRDHELTLFPDSLSILEWTKQQGIQNFIYTHKGDNTSAVLELFGMSDYFDEVLHSQSGFARKPDPEALLYLIDKYGLDMQKTFYIGDRLLDKDFAERAGVHSISLSQPNSSTNTFVQSLLAITELPFLAENKS